MKKVNIILAQFSSFSMKALVNIRDFFTDSYKYKEIAKYDQEIRNGINDFRNIEEEFKQGLQAIAARSYNRETSFDKKTLQAAN